MTNMPTHALKSSDQLRERCLSSETVFNGQLIQVRQDRIQTVKGIEATREVVDHGAAVVVLPFDKYRRSVIMVQQYRYAIQDSCLEFPAGLIDATDASPLAAAKRELKEETGRSASEWIPMGHFYPTPGFCNESFYFFMASDFQVSETNFDDDEELIIHEVAIEELSEWIQDFKIKDLKTVALFQMARAYMENS